MAKKRRWCPIHKRAFWGRAWCGHRRHCKADLKEKTVKVDVVPTAVPVKVKFRDPDQIVTNLRSNLASFEEDIAKELTKITQAKVAIMESNGKIDELKKQKAHLVRSLSRLIR